MQRIDEALSFLLRRVLAPTLALASGLAATAVSAQRVAPVHGASPLVLEVVGLRSDRGVLRAGLFDGASRWLAEGQERATCRASVRGPRTRCDLGVIPEGHYAIAFMHDEDEDGALDRDWIGLPQEGFGFSNDAPVVLSPPGFDSAVFVHSGAEVVRATARYGL